jgi:N6-adenosine-specific RNA methylase IME4
MKIDIFNTDNKYRVIYADPPYQYRNVRTGGSMKSGSAQKYPVMKTEDICGLPVNKISDNDSVLFL